MLEPFASNRQLAVGLFVKRHSATCPARPTSALVRACHAGWLSLYWAIIHREGPSGDGGFERLDHRKRRIELKELWHVQWKRREAACQRGEKG